MWARSVRRSRPVSASWPPWAWTAAAMGADQTNQMGVGHNNFPPDYSRRGVRAGSGQSGYDGATDESANPVDPTVANGYDGSGWGGQPPDVGTGGSGPATGTLPPTGTPASTAAQGGGEGCCQHVRSGGGRPGSGAVTVPCRRSTMPAPSGQLVWGA